MKQETYKLPMNGSELIAEFNDLADQAHGSVMMRHGDTVVLVTAVMSPEERGGIDFFPLTVEYEEKFYSTGQILGSRFVRREGKPSDEAVLSGRIVDRTIRPLFEDHIRNEVQVIVTVLSIGTYDPDVLGVIGASLALGTSHIPWNGPVSAVRVGRNAAGEWLINPTYALRDQADYVFDLVACGKDGMINMIEVGSQEITSADVMKALREASAAIEQIQVFQKDIIAKRGAAKVSIPKPEIPVELTALFDEHVKPHLFAAVFESQTKAERKAGERELLSAWQKAVAEKFPEQHLGALAAKMFDDAINDLIHTEAIENGKRADGRGIDDIRPLFAKAGGVSPILHGSGVFYRGGTHVLSALTLGSPQDFLVVEGSETQEKKHFMHHYNFPPFSTGETGRVGSTNRRMIGHGALAEKALAPIIPSQEEFPYTIRIVSEALASNGSTSMASVCASTLALMDGGVPIKAPVAGIASGLMMHTEGGKVKKYKVLTDIQGPEDHHGDMDFKVAGTRKGITAVQMDVKVEGVPLEILEEAFGKAESARMKILDLIESEIAAPRAQISPNAPQILTLKVKQDQIGLIIGSGGKTIKSISETTGAEVNIEDDGTVFISGKNGSAEKARTIIADMTREYAVGETFEGEVVKILDFGVFVKLNENADGLVHVSEMAPFHIDAPAHYVKVGDKVPVVIKVIDDRKRLNLSIKQANPHFFKEKEPQKKV